MSMLMFILDAIQNLLRMMSKAIHSVKEPDPKRITSSTNRRWVSVKCGEIFIPLIRPLFLASAIIILSPSITSIKSRGERGHLWQIPLEAGKKLEGIPLMSTTKFADVIQPIIQLTVRRGIPI